MVALIVTGCVILIPCAAVEVPFREMSPPPERIFTPPAEAPIQIPSTDELEAGPVGKSVPWDPPPM